MTETTFLFTALLITSIAMAVAMTLAWFQFGRENHVGLWACAYMVSSCQWLINALALRFASPALMYLSGVAMIASIGLTFAGIQLRAAPLRRLAPLFWASLLFSLGCGIIAYAISSTLVIASVIPAYVGILMAAGAYIIATPARSLRGSEIVYAGSLILFALFEIALCLVGLKAASERVGLWLNLYRSMVAWGLPMLFVGAAIASILMIAGDLTARLSRQSMTDPLTGVGNRRAFDDASRICLAQSSRTNEPLGLVLCDLDGLKLLNDMHGHMAGDAALKRLAQALTGELPSNEMVWRLGGDEFALLLQGNSRDDVYAILDRVRSRLATAGLACSFGFTLARDTDRGVEELIARADCALYEAKRAGKGQVREV